MHFFKDFSNHNHSPQASSASVAKAIAGIKRWASETREKPIQIIQNSIVDISDEICPYLPSCNALRRKITQVRKMEMSLELQSIAEINIPNSLVLH